MDKAKVNQITEHIVVGNLSQDINHKRMKSFMKENRLCNIYQVVNGFNNTERDETFKNRKP